MYQVLAMKENKLMSKLIYSEKEDKLQMEDWETVMLIIRF